MTNALIIIKLKDVTMQTIPAPADPWVAHAAWLFFVENLQPGFIVNLVTESGELSQQSGRRVSAADYARIFDQVQVSQPGAPGAPGLAADYARIITQVQGAT